jgi:hypothetical protein
MSDLSYDREKQVKVARVLSELLVRADKDDVPPLRWTVNLVGWSLHGETDLPFDKDPRGTFDAWVRYLRLTLNVDSSRASGDVDGVPLGIAVVDDTSPETSGKAVTS